MIIDCIIWSLATWSLIILVIAVVKSIQIDKEEEKI